MSLWEQSIQIIAAKWKSFSTNSTSSTYTVRKGQRIGQLVFTKSAHLPITTVNSLPDTERGSSGFGSTEIHSAKWIQRTSFHTPLTTIPEHGIDENDSHEDEELLPEPRSISHLIPHLSPKLQIPQSYDVSNLSATELDAILHPFRNEVLVDDVTPPHEESAPFDDDRHVRLLHSVWWYWNTGCRTVGWCWGLI